MALIEGDAHTVLKHVADVFATTVPGSKCELQDYQFRIGCGVMDSHGELHETVMLLRGLDHETVEHHADRLGRKVAGYGTGGPL